MLFLPVAMSFLLLSACATTAGYEKKVSIWSGQPVKRLIKKWGEPDLILTLKNGNKEYQYLKTREVATPKQETNPFADFTPSKNAVSYDQNNNKFGPIPKGQYWGQDSISPSFSLSQAPLDAYQGKAVPKVLYCHTFFEINVNGRIISVHFKGNDCLA